MSNDNHHQHKPGSDDDNCRSVHFRVNDDKVESDDPTLTGAQIKALAEIPLADELFLETKCGDEVVPNDATVLVRNKDRFHSMPSPQFGAADQKQRQIDEVLALHEGEARPTPNGAIHLVLRDFAVPPGYSHENASVLVKLPKLFPDAAPDMFWLRPAVELNNGQAPKATSMEVIDGEPWQRFSWHLKQGSWRPGVSTLRDFIRAVIGRLTRAV